MISGIYNTAIYRTWKRFLTWIGDLMLATKPPLVKAKHIRKLQDLIKVGDIIGRRYTYYLDSYFIKGNYSHSGFVVDENVMIHAIAEGVGKIDVIDFVKDADGFILLSPKYDHPGNIAQALMFASKNIGKPYDFVFDKSKSNAFYCHEFSTACLKEGCVQVKPKGKVIYIDDIIGVCDIIYESHPLKVPEVKKEIFKSCRCNKADKQTIYRCEDCESIFCQHCSTNSRCPACLSTTKSEAGVVA